MERCTIIVNARDRFSSTARCLETLIANTPEPHDLIVVIGGAPEHLKQEWRACFSKPARFIFEPHFLNQAQARNIGLRQATTRLAVVIDNDNFVRSGWLGALVRCQQETGAVMVAPLVLETPRKIHTAGCHLYITQEHGKAWGHKELRFHGMVYADGANLTRQRTDYGELHCLLVEVEPTLRLGAFDERIQEVGEVDAGLTWAKHGHDMWFEPASVVYYALHGPITVDDIRLFAWRWDMRAIWDGYRYFEQKWALDITEHGAFRDFLLRYNKQLGLLPRLWPSRVSLALDRWIGQLRQLLVLVLRLPKALLRSYKARWMGDFAWPTPSRYQRRLPWLTWMER